MSQFIRPKKRKGSKIIWLFVFVILIILFFVWFSDKATAPQSVNKPLELLKEDDFTFIAPEQPLLPKNSLEDTNINHPENKQNTKKETVTNKELPAASEKKEALVGGQEKNQLTLTSSGTITVTQPPPHAVLTSPFVVTGRAAVPDNVLYVRVTNTSGAVLISEQVNVHSTQEDKPGTFDITIYYQFQTTKEGFIEVYSEGDVDNVKIPVRFE